MSFKLILSIDHEPEKNNKEWRIKINIKKGLFSYYKFLYFEKTGDEILVSDFNNFIEQLENFIKFMKEEKDEKVIQNVLYPCVCVLSCDRKRAVAKDFIMYSKKSLSFVTCVDGGYISNTDLTIPFSEIENNPIAEFEKLLIDIKIVFDRILKN
jgi:hypothetical protein